MSIRLLDENTISKIAAGEIIENPASIIKELLENSIDAGAENIVIEVKGEVGSYLRITDDGDGIAKDDINLAFMRHSTSKLHKVEDLYNIVSLGFRGEALASISTISHVELLTKHKDEKVGTRAIVENGEVVEKNNVGLPKGTTFYVKDVFYNTPVRKKYLKNDNIEFGYIQEVVQKIALSQKNISIKLIRDGKIILNTNKELDLLNHIYTLLGKDIATNLIETDFKSQSYKIKAFFSNNKLYRSSRNHQYIYINGRYVKNLDISRRIEKGYYSLIPLNRYPVFILFIEIDPILIDVNIHPKKHEIKLSRENNLLAILSEMLEDVLYPNRSIENISFDKVVANKKDTQENVTVFEMFNEDPEEIIENNFIEESKYNNYIDVNEIESTLDPIEDFAYNTDNNDIKNTEKTILKKSEMFFENNILKDNELKSNNIESFMVKKEEKLSQIDKSLLDTKISGTLFKTFIILESTRNSKCFLIDQHAAHERVLYEKFKNQFENANIDKQILLKPEVIELNAEEKINIENNIDLLNSIGFDVETFGENSLIVREVPMIFGLPAYWNFIYDVFDALNRDIKSSYEVDPYKIMKKACKAAVKAGDSLTDMEIQSLVTQLIQCENPYTCPHGRPTIIEFTKSDLEKMFLREM